MTPLSRDLHPSNGRRAPKDEVVVSITSALNHRGRKQEEQLPADHDELDETFPTPQQHELLRLLAEGADDEFAARRLDLEISDVRRLLLEMSTELGACNRFQLALRAREEGWV